MFKDKSLLELDGGLQTLRSILALVYMLCYLLIAYVMTQLLQTLFNLYFHY